MPAHAQALIVSVCLLRGGIPVSLYGLVDSGRTAPTTVLSRPLSDGLAYNAAAGDSHTTAGRMTRSWLVQWCCRNHCVLPCMRDSRRQIQNQCMRQYGTAVSSRQSCGLWSRQQLSDGMENYQRYWRSHSRSRESVRSLPELQRLCRAARLIGPSVRRRCSLRQSIRRSVLCQIQQALPGGSRAVEAGPVVLGCMQTRPSAMPRASYPSTQRVVWTH